jgi:glycosyltransferase involved in cell wall biosynthesis
MGSTTCGVLVNVEQRFVRTPDGTVWTDGPFPYSFWCRYLDVFDSVRVVARVRDVPAAAETSQAITGPSVQVVALPHYVGPFRALLALRTVRTFVNTALRRPDAVILRIPSLIACQIAAPLLRAGRPYGVEVVADAFDVLGPGSVRHLLRPAFRRWLTREQGRQCRAASAAAYVTKETLQKRYPCGGLAVGVSDVQLGEGMFRQPFSTHYSSVQLDRDAFTHTGDRRAPASRHRVITIGSLEQPYKGVDLLIDAVAQLARQGADLELVVVGDGRQRSALESRAERLGIATRVQFKGQVGATANVRRELDAATLFVLPSRTEGLPRAMVEAMARGLPCIGSAAGGIPELLSPEDIVPIGDVAALAASIRDVLANPARRRAMAERNLTTAAEYREDVLRERRVSFYRHVRMKTAEWKTSTAS